TVVQFRTIDWMLEACTLRIRLPGHGQNNAPNFNTKTNRVEVHRINQSSILDIASLAVDSLPPAREKLASVQIDANDGLEWAYHFPCAMDTLHTFIITAADFQTDLDWWQDKRLEIPCALLLIQ
ncbi:hypothetical protein B0H15DRAFT_789709, partial [Mycena belliarum]